MKSILSILLLSAVGLGLSALNRSDSAELKLSPDDLNYLMEQLPELPSPEQISNPEAVVPPQCYTKTEGHFNPCYTCHQNHQDGRPNYMNDMALQAAYSFSELGETNHWYNLFVDRRSVLANIPDQSIDHYIAQDNYKALAEDLTNRGWQGYVPDLKNLAYPKLAFDKQGFATDGSGWVAFNYKPLPSTFWHTNGSADDVMIRLPPAFRQTASGEPSRFIYQLNLAMLEANIKHQSELSINPTRETKVGLDLNQDGHITDVIISKMPIPNHYWGKAAIYKRQPYLYPEGTEFLHSVRYLDPTQERVVAAPRMKELRYMRKHTMISSANLRSRYTNERLEKLDGQLPYYVWLGDRGYDNGFGWELSGFIEDKNGALRPQSREETLFCMGCHSTVGATMDQSFSFARKVDGPSGWRYIDLSLMQDQARRQADSDQAEELGEIAQYFLRVGGGDEFRENDQIRQRFFDDSGALRMTEMAGKSVADIITPSPRRARALNKAYATIVQTQSFVFGRDANLAPVGNVYREIDPEQTPTLPSERQFNSDLRLVW